jgi:hypothetical protein
LVPLSYWEPNRAAGNLSVLALAADHDLGLRTRRTARPVAWRYTIGVHRQPDEESPGIRVIPVNWAQVAAVLM